MTQQVSTFYFPKTSTGNVVNASMQSLKIKRAFSNVPLWAFHKAFSESLDETSISDMLSLARTIASCESAPRINLNETKFQEDQRIASEVILVGGAYEIDDERKAALHVPSLPFKFVRRVASKAGLDAPRWKIVYAYFGGEL